jgi:bifunctional DNA-binding transcriptional regulator/antitoxin component of YhaV-PrlF toxin-antitoxin module
MWLKNNSTSKGRRNKAEEESYLIINSAKGSPALRISEKARKELGWTEGEFLNIFMDNEKIMMQRDNDSQEFEIKIYRSHAKVYGFNIYSKTIKEVSEKLNWKNKSYPVHIYRDGNELTLVVFKNEFISKTELALLEKKHFFKTVAR